MDPIYVTGHRNPDTDSIVAAIAYTALRNACGDREYQAACLGKVSDESQIVLDRFGFQPPKRIYDLYNQVRDLDFDTPPVLNTGVTVGRAWDRLQECPAITAVPVAKENGTLYGILSRTDIANYNMSKSISGVLEEVPLFNVLSVLEGRILNEAGENADSIAGEVIIALPQGNGYLPFQSKDSIVLCGHQPDMIRKALEMNVRNLVFSWENLDNAAAAYEKLIAKIATLKDEGGIEPMMFADLKKRFAKALEGDLNTSVAVTAVYDVLKAKTTDATKLALIADFDKVLCLNLLSAAENLRKKQAEEEAANADPEIDALVAARTAAKKAKNWAEADRIRDELKARGIEIIDTPQGAKWRKV